VAGTRNFLSQDERPPQGAFQEKVKEKRFEKKALAVEEPRFGKGSGAKEDPSPASIFIIMKQLPKCQKIFYVSSFSEGINSRPVTNVVFLPKIIKIGSN